MKNEIIRLGCGLDMGKDKFDACFGVGAKDGSFVVKATKKFDNTKSGINAFLKWLDQNHAKHDPSGELPFQAALETTGVYHENVCSSLYDAGQPVCLEVAVRVKKYLQSIGQNSKTDKLDAQGICRMACERKLKLWQPFSPNILSIRAASRHRKSLIDSLNRIKNKLHAMTHSAHNDKEIIDSLKRNIKFLAKEIDRAESLILVLYEADEELKGRIDPIVESVKGLGLITALTVVAETNGFGQIRGARQLCSYAGYDIIENQSGNSSRPTKISGRGNARLRSDLYMCALTMGRYTDSPFYDFFKRIRERNPKVYKVANVAVQRKLLVLIYTLFKNKTSFDPLYQEKLAETSSSEQCPELHGIAVA